MITFTQLFTQVSFSRSVCVHSLRPCCVFTSANFTLCVIVSFQHLNENLAKLTVKFEKATADKLKCQQEAESTARTISLANRLVRTAAGSQRAALTSTITYIQCAVRM